MNIMEFIVTFYQGSIRKLRNALDGWGSDLKLALLLRDFAL